MSSVDTLPFDNTYARLPEAFHARVHPTPVRAPSLVRLNHELASEVGLDPALLSTPDGIAMLAGNHVPAQSDPISMVYAGHQFGNWVPRLGDGRAILLGEFMDRAGRRRDLQLKGAGLTPFSRMADGRAVLGPVIREYLASEAMAGLGIPTTRALAIVATGEPVYRERVEPGAILVRVATSHVRIGTFEYFHHRRDTESVRTLADYVIDRHYPELRDDARPYHRLLERMIDRTAALVANWMLVGFIHGVMNTDNMSIVGETIDFGPFGFVDTYHPATVYSSVDTGGRYAFNQQPRIAHWNLAQFAEAMLPLLGAVDDQENIDWARGALEAFGPAFEQRYHAGLRAKLGLRETRPEDIDLAGELFACMARERADFTLTFRRLADVCAEDTHADEPVRSLFAQPEAFDDWAARWRERLVAENSDDAQRRERMRAVNPAYVLRNHLAQRAIDAAVGEGNYQVMEDLLQILADPFSDHPEFAAYSRPPEPGEQVLRTFCGT